MTLRVQSSTLKVVLTYGRQKRISQTQFEIVRERTVANQAAVSEQEARGSVVVRGFRRVRPGVVPSGKAPLLVSKIAD